MVKAVLGCLNGVSQYRLWFYKPKNGAKKNGSGHGTEYKNCGTDFFPRFDCMEIPHQAYDAYFKENLPEVLPTLLSLVSGERVVSAQALETDLTHTVLNRDLDFAFEITFADGRTDLVQIEEETGEDPGLADKLIGQLVAAKVAYKRYPTQYIGFLGSRIRDFSAGLPVKNERGEVVALLMVRAFRFMDIPARPLFDLNTPKGFAIGIFCNLSGIERVEIIESYRRVAPLCTARQWDQLVIGVSLAHKKGIFEQDFYHSFMAEMVRNVDYGREFSLDLAYNTPFVSEFILEDIQRQIREAVAAEKLAAEKLAVEELAAEKMRTVARKLQAAGNHPEFIFDVTGLRPEEYQ